MQELQAPRFERPLFYSRDARAEDSNIMMFAMLSSGRFHQSRSIDKFEVAISGTIGQKPSIIQGQSILVVQTIIQVVPLPNFPEGYRNKLRFRHIETVDIPNPTDESVQKAIYETVTKVYDKFYEWLEEHGFTEYGIHWIPYEGTPEPIINADGSLSKELTDAIKQSAPQKPEAANSPLVLAK